VHALNEKGPKDYSGPWSSTCCRELFFKKVVSCTLSMSSDQRLMSDGQIVSHTNDFVIKIGKRFFFSTSLFPYCLTQGCSLTSIKFDDVEVSGNDATISFSGDPSHSDIQFFCKLDRERFRSCKSISIVYA